MTNPDPRPTGNYYENRTAGFSQGDIFTFPVAIAVTFTPLQDLTEGEGPDTLRLVSGPLEGRSHAMLISPTLAIRGRGTRQYITPLRTLVPIVSIDKLKARKEITEGDERTGRDTDGLFRYMYLPASQGLGFEDSLALLDEPVTVAHELLIGDDPQTDLRLTQLTLVAARQLQRKLVWFATGGGVYPADAFDPPMD